MNTKRSCTVTLLYLISRNILCIRVALYSKSTESYNCIIIVFFYLTYGKNILQSKHIRKSKVYEVSQIGYL